MREMSCGQKRVNMCMKDRSFSVKILFSILSLLYASGALGKETEVFYTLEAIKFEKHTTYDSDFTVLINGLEWRSPGNQNWSDGWRIGGNGLNKTDRSIAGMSAMEASVGKVTLNYGGVTSDKFTVHSISLTVASDASYGNVIATVTKNNPPVSSAGAIDFVPSSGSVWPAGSYYRLTIKCSNSTSANQSFIFRSLVFYEGTDDVPAHTVTWSVNGHVTTEKVSEGTAIAFVGPASDIPEGKTFVGWYTGPYEHPTEAPAYVRSATMGTSDVTYYAVFATKESTGETQETKVQTLQYDTWTYRGSTQDKDSYRLFHADSYVESEPFDLSRLSKVIVYGGTFNGKDNNKLTIGDGTDIWKEVTVSGNDETKAHTYTGGTPLAGIGTLRVTSCSGKASSGTGIRISRIEIYVQSSATYSGFTTSVQAPSYTAGTLDFVAHNAEGYWATFSSGQVTFFPRGVTPYAVTVEGSRMVLRGGDDVFGRETSVSIAGSEESGHYVPANAGVLLNSSDRSAAYYTVTGRSVAPIEASENHLRPGTGGETTGEGCRFYRLAYNNYAEQSGLGFYFGEGCSSGEAFVCKQGSAYLAVPEEVSVKHFTFGEEDEDGMEAPFRSEDREAGIFNLAGQRLRSPRRGVNVVNGKKYVAE